MDLAKAIGEHGSDLRIRQGVAITDPASGLLTVRLGGSTDPADNVPAYVLDSGSCRANDPIWLLQTGGVLICLGAVSIPWTAYTPAFTASGGATAGGTLVGKYKRVGRTGWVHVDMTYTSGMTLPVGTYYLGFPPGWTAATGAFSPGPAMYHTAGGAPMAGTCSPFYSGAGATKLAVSVDNVAGAWGQNSPVIPNVGHILTVTWVGELST